MGFWSKLGKIASIAAPIAAAPFTGGASLALIGAGAGAANAALNKQGLKGLALGAGLGAIPGLSGAGKAAGAVTPTLGAAAKQAGTSAVKQLGPGAAASLVSGRAGGGGQGGDMAGEGGGFWQNYGPLIAQGAGVAGGIYAGKKATSSAMERSPEEQTALTGAQGAAGTMLGAGRNLFGQAGALTGQGRDYLQGPANYYQTLLRGNRAAMAGAVAGPTAQLTDVYRGAERGLERSGVRGAARDVASADLNRQRASQIAGLTTGVQPAAAAGLAGLGSEVLGAAAPLYGAGANLYSNAGNIYGNLLGQGAVNRKYGREEGEKTGKAIGGLIADVGKVAFGGKGNGKMAGPPPPMAVQAGLPSSGVPGQVGPLATPSFGGYRTGVAGVPGQVGPIAGYGGQFGGGQQAGLRFPGSVQAPNFGGGGAPFDSRAWDRIRF